MHYPSLAIVAGAVTTYAAATALGQLIARRRFPLPAAERRIGCVDGLRGYLALSVLIHHFIIWMQVTRLGGAWEPPSVHLFEELGAGGVALFFMTTGLVFYPRVLAGFRACWWPAVFIARLFRIVPLLGLSVAIVSAIVAIRTGHGLDRGFPRAALQWVTTWGEPPLLGDPDSGRLNAYVLWSLWYEWLFYLFVLPACALARDLIGDRLPSWTVPMVLLVGALIAQTLNLPYTILTFLPLFAIGMLAFECRRRETIARHLRSPAAGIAAAAALGLAMLGFQLPYGLALPLFGFFFVCVACGNAMGGVLRTKGALVLGECSYGLYLLHGIVLSLMFVDAARLTGSLGTQHLPVLLPCAAVALVFLASAVHVLVERPAMRMGREVARLSRGRPWRGAVPELEAAP